MSVCYSIRLRIVCCNHPASCKTDTMAFKFGRNIGNFSTQIGIENGTNRPKDASPHYKHFCLQKGKKLLDALYSKIVANEPVNISTSILWTILQYSNLELCYSVGFQFKKRNNTAVSHNTVSI